MSSRILLLFRAMWVQGRIIGLFQLPFIFNNCEITVGKIGHFYSLNFVRKRSYRPYVFKLDELIEHCDFD